MASTIIMLCFDINALDDLDREYKLIVSKNGKNLLLLDGYAYRKYMTSKNSNNSYWTCTQRGCRAKGSLATSGVFSLTKYVHNHSPDHKEMEKKVYVSQLRQLALTTQLPHERLLKAVGLTEQDDPGRKYRAMINFWRWHAKRKRQNAELIDVYSDKSAGELSYRFVRVDNTHYMSFRNYLYRKYKTGKADGGSYWRCRYPDCPSRSRILPDRSLSVIIFNHDHPEEDVDGETVDQDLREQLQDIVLNTDLDTSEILTLCGVEKDLQMKKFVTSLRNRKQRIQRERSKGDDDRHDEEEFLTEHLEFDDQQNSMDMKRVPQGVVVKMPNDILLLQEEEESGGQTVVALDSMLKVVDEDGNEKTIMFKHETELDGDDDDEEDDDNVEEVEYKQVDISELTALYVSGDRDEPTFILNQ